VRAPMTVLGTDGFGRSANRKALRRFFEVDREHIALAALASLAEQDRIGADVVVRARGELGIDPAAASPWTV